MSTETRGRRTYVGGYTTPTDHGHHPCSPEEVWSYSPIIDRPSPGFNRGPVSPGTYVDLESQLECNIWNRRKTETTEVSKENRPRGTG